MQEITKRFRNIKNKNIVKSEDKQSTLQMLSVAYDENYHLPERYLELKKKIKIKYPNPKCTKEQ